MQMVMDSAHWTDIHPLNNVKNSDGPIQFNISGTAEKYIDLNDTLLYLRCKTVEADGTELAAGAIAPINNILHSLFSDVQLKLGDKVVEGGVSMYPYRAYLNNLLLFSKSTKAEQLSMSGFYKDTAGQFDTLTNANAGFQARRTLTAESKTFELLGPLCLDFLTQSKYLLSQVDMHLRLTRSNPNFYMQSATAGHAGSKILIEEAILYVRNVKIAPSIIMEHEKQLVSMNAQYPIQRSEMITYTIATGSISHIKEGLFRGQLPKLLIIGMVDNDVYNGTLATNPFNFAHNDLKQLALYRDGECIPYRPFTPNFANGLCLREFMSLYQSREIFNRDESFGITLADYSAGGYNLFAFNLAPDLSVAGHAQPYREGNLRIELNFSKALTKSINVIAMAIFDGKLEITRQRQILLDYKN